MTPVYDWDDRLNKRVVIGYLGTINDVEWKGRDGLLPDRNQRTAQHLQTPNGKAGRARAREANQLPTPHEMGEAHASPEIAQRRSTCRHCKSVVRQGARICGRCLGKARWAA